MTFGDKSGGVDDFDNRRVEWQQNFFVFLGIPRGIRRGMEQLFCFLDVEYRDLLFQCVPVVFAGTSSSFDRG